MIFFADVKFIVKINNNNNNSTFILIENYKILTLKSKLIEIFI